MTDRSAISELLQDMLHISRQAADPVADAICRLQPARVPEGVQAIVQRKIKWRTGEVEKLAAEERRLASHVDLMARHTTALTDLHDIAQALAAAPAAEGVAQTSDAWDAIERHCVVSEAVAPDRADPYGTIGRLIDYHANPAPESREADHSVGVNKMVPEAGQREGVEAVKQSLTGGKANE